MTDDFSDRDEDAATPKRLHVVDFPHTDVDDIVERTIAMPMELAGFGRIGETSGREQWLAAVLAQLEHGEALMLHLDLELGLRIAVRARAPSARIEARAAELAQALSIAAACAFPDLKPAHAAKPAKGRRRPAGPVRLKAYTLKPGGRAVGIADPADAALQDVASAGAKAKAGGTLRLRSEPARAPDISAIVELLSRKELAGAEVVLSLSPFQLAASHARALRAFLDRLSDRLQNARLATLFHIDDQALMQLKQWCIAEQGLRVEATLAAPVDVMPVLRDMLCQAIYGDRMARRDEPDALDLTTTWPGQDLTFLTRLHAVPIARARLVAQKRAAAMPKHAGVVLGRLQDDRTLRVDWKALEQHLYMVGGTGTGKSTLMLNMIAEAMRGGRSVVVIDPHGDLVEKVLAIVPPARRADVVFLHPTDARGAFTMNALERQGDDIEAEHARIVEELIELFKRTLWPNAPEAFGPMFENYFRNTLLLLLSAQDRRASIVDMPRVIGDSGFRRELLQKCTNKDVAYFWRQTATQAGGEASLDNVAPYIMAKLAPFLGNAPLKRILGANSSTVDFRAIIARQQICLVNLAQPTLGRGGSRFLGGIITARLIAAAKAQVARAPEDRQRVTAFLDEFQGYVSAGLADGLAEVRKFGINLVLANQSLAQLAGDRYQAEIAESVMSNAASLVAFRVGTADALRLSMKFEPAISVKQLTGLPNYYAAATLLQGSEPGAPVVFATESDPKPARGATSDWVQSAVLEATVTGELRKARTGLVELLRRRHLRMCSR